MHIVPLTNKIAFGAGKSFLYTDFDGTFLPATLHDIYWGNETEKANAVRGFNKYFGEFDEFVKDKKDKFTISITTGRRIIDETGNKGFKSTYDKMRAEGISFPEIKEIITTEGKDIYNFATDGSINLTPTSNKKAAIKALSGWDFEQIKSILTKTAEATKTNYSLTDWRGEFVLSIKLDDNSKLEKFKEELSKQLQDKVKFRLSIKELKEYDKSKNLTIKYEGIKLQPLVDGHRIRKNLDVRLALKDAIKNNDFVIAAGNHSNDKEMVNIFKYVTLPDGLKTPSRVEDITEEHIKAVKAEIENLPLKILFIKPDANEEERLIKLYEFVKKQKELFPDKIEIVEQTKLNGENNFLISIKKAIAEYATKNKMFKDGLDNINNPPKSNSKFYKIVFGAFLAGVGLIFAAKKLYVDYQTNKTDVVIKENSSN